MQTIGQQYCMIDANDFAAKPHTLPESVRSFRASKKPKVLTQTPLE